MAEYIVQIEESEKNMEERFVGQLRSYPELIRCKDCLYSTCIEEENDWWECEHDHRVNHGDGFCNWSERKEE